MIIEVVKVFHYQMEGWVLKGTESGRTFFWTGYGWSMGNSIPKYFEDEESAREDVQTASGYVTNL